MTDVRSSRRLRRKVALLSAGVIVMWPATAFGAAGTASAASVFQPGNLLVSTSTYVPDNNIVAGSTQLPPGCGSSSDPCVTAVAGGQYPYVFNNDSVDGSFGVSSPITLNELTPSGSPLAQVTVPNSQTASTSSADQLVTSFSSKSEIALNQSTDGNAVTFMGYNAPVDTVDVSNSNTPGAVDATNPDAGPSFYRAVAQLGLDGSLHFTETNAYSGNNGRAAVLSTGTNTYYTAGNAGNGSNPEPQGVVQGAGSQQLAPSTASESAQTPGAPTPAGNFNVTQLGDPADKSAKDDNFRGLTVSRNVVYLTKGSGGNGVNSVYFIDPTGSACPNGTGIPASGAPLPTSVPSYSTSNTALGLTASNPGLSPTTMCVLKGFPTSLAKSATNASLYPFGIWFANPTTLYVADEGSGDATFSNTTTPLYTNAAASTTAGLQKWVYSSATGQWNLSYTLQSGLNLGQPYSPPGYPTGFNITQGGKGGPWSPATDGLRNVTGKVNGDGTVTLYASTSTVSGSGDQGADPNQLVAITDQVGATAPQAGEQFQTLVAPASGTVVRGVSFTPGTGATPPASTPEVPWAPLAPLAAVVAGGGALWVRSRRRSHRAA